MKFFLRATRLPRGMRMLNYFLIKQGHKRKTKDDNRLVAADTGKSGKHTE
jgi:hypothetical protein